MHMTADTMFQDFPYKIRDFLKNLRIKAVARAVGNVPCGNPDVWRQVAIAIDEIQEEGYSRVSELMEIMPASGDYTGAMRFSKLLDAWELNPEMAVDAPRAAVERTRPRVSRLGYKRPAREKPRSMHAAPVNASSPDYAWLEFRSSAVYRDSKSIVILYDPGSQRIADRIITAGRRIVYPVIYSKDSKLHMPDRSIRSLNSIADNCLSPVDILIATCEKFNSRREIFSGVESVHEALIRLGRTGLVGPGTKKVGIGYFWNQQYEPEYLNPREFIFKADMMISESGDDINNFIDIDGWREVIARQVELERRRDDSVELF